jgi:hypothetical protein
MRVPHESSDFLKNRNFLPYLVSSPKFLSSSDAQNLSNALNKDAEGYLYNGILSLGTGIKSILNENYGWATVKLYYSVFYLARTLLGVNDIGIVYDGSKPFSIISQAGEQLRKRKGNTHELVLDLFREYFSGHVMLSNQINSQDPLKWLMEQRELMNYKSAVMPDPNLPKLYKELISNGTVRQWLSTYFSDDREFYTFSETHACLAYPFRFLIHTIEEFHTQNIHCRYLTPHLSFIKSLFSDKTGSFIVLLKKFEEL